MPEDCLQALSLRLRDFARARNWEQFHSPKNLAMALAGEAGELLEHFQWLSERQSYELDPVKREAVALELADVLIYVLRCAERLELDVVEAAWRKVAINERRYPVDKVYGDARRASEYDERA